MPNWVYSYVSVNGKREALLAFAEKARQEYETLWITSEWKFDAELGKNVKVPESERKIEREMSGESPLSFWNFVRPTDEELPYYFGHKTKPEDEEDANATTEERLAKRLTFSGSGWYDWNVRNWGTKWDANEVELDEKLDELKEGDSLTYRYSTAWGIPEPVMRAMVEQHPELSFSFECEEEQGWGANYEGDEGILSMVKEWDIPSCHADFVELGRECWGCESGDQEEMYEDCPDKNKEFRVVVQQVYVVKATNEEDAKQLVVANTTKPEFHSPDVDKAHFAEDSITAICITENEVIEFD